MTNYTKEQREIITEFFEKEILPLKSRDKYERVNYIN